jgi:acetyl esterase/lipase
MKRYRCSATGLGLRRFVVLAAISLACISRTATPLTAEEAERPYQQTENIIYAEEYGIGLLMDVFVPTGRKNGRGVIDVVSGAWHSDRGKLRDHERAQVFKILCQRGYTVFAIRPGSLDKFTIPEMVSHAERGVGWVKQHAGEYGVDPEQLGLMGASAGGHLASLVAVVNGSSSRDAAPPAAVKAAGIFFPPTDFLNYGGRVVDPRSVDGLGALVRRIAFRDKVEDLTDEQIHERLVEISPARRVTADAPPFLLIHGSADLLVPLQQSKQLLKALQDKNVPAQLIIKRLGGHPWPTIHEEVAVLTDWFDQQLGVAMSASRPVAQIRIDGKFDDWANLKSYTDPPGDTHDTEHDRRDDVPKPVNHPDVDLLEYKLTHDAENLYFYFRSRGRIGRNQLSADGKPAGRYYVIVTIDVDNDDETGYWIHEGGYFPTSRGYDVNAEVEYFDGELNTACYLNHGALDAKELHQAFLDQSAGQYRQGHDGPYPAGFMRLLPGTYKQYTQWVYHEDGTITFVRDKGPVVPGIANAAISEDGHELEAVFPLKGFLVDEQGDPVIKIGDTIDLSFSLEASGELAPDGLWASDTAEPINGYVLSEASQNQQGELKP